MGSERSRGCAAVARFMRRVALSEHPVGRVVARTIRSGAGAVLLERGVALDGRMIACLRSLGVTHVYLQSERSDDADAGHEARVRDEVAQREARRFGDVAEDPLRAALLAAVIEIKTSARLEAPATAGGDGGGQGHA